MDLSKLSDDELIALKDGDLSKLSDETLLSLKEPEKSFDFGGLAREAVQGATFEFADELEAAAKGGLEFVKGGEFTPAYERSMQDIAREREVFQQENPNLALAAQLAGGLTTGLAGGARLAGAKALQGLPSLAKTGLIGATEGTVYGAGTGKDAQERIEKGVFGGVVGGLAGPALQLAGSGVGSVAKPFYDAARRKLSSDPASDAAGALSSVLVKEGVKDVTKLAPSRGAQATLADITATGRGVLEGLASDPNIPGVRALSEKTLKGRAEGQVGRISESLVEGIDVDPNLGFRDFVNKLEFERGALAKPLYEEAEKTPIKLTKSIQAYVKKDSKLKELRDVYKDANEAKDLKLELGEDVNPFVFLNDWKISLDNKIGSLLASGEKQKASKLIEIKNKVVGDIDKNNPAYSKAREVWAGKTQMISAADQGKKILRTDADDLDDFIESYSKSEKEAFRVGAYKAIREQMLGAVKGNNSARRIMPEIKLERIKRAFPDEKSFNKFRNDLEFEAKIFDTNQVLTNSLTALRQSGKELVQDMTPEEVNMIGSNVSDIAAQALKKLTKRKLSDEAKLELGRIVLTPINELNEDLVKRMNRTIIMQFPASERSKAIGFMREINKPSVSGAMYGVGAGKLAEEL